MSDLKGEIILVAESPILNASCAKAGEIFKNASIGTIIGERRTHLVEPDTMKGFIKAVIRATSISKGRGPTFAFFSTKEPFIAIILKMLLLFRSSMNRDELRIVTSNGTALATPFWRYLGTSLDDVIFLTPIPNPIPTETNRKKIIGTREESNGELGRKAPLAFLKKAFGGRVRAAIITAKNRNP